MGFGSESFEDQVLFIAPEDKLKPINMLLTTKMADGSESSSKISVFVVNPNGFHRANACSEGLNETSRLSNRRQCGVLLIELNHIRCQK